MKKIRFCIFLSSFVVFGFSTINAQIASGGAYKLEQSVIGSGGTSSGGAGNTYTLESVIGEPIAGTTSVNSPFIVKGGFFAAQTFAPTAAGVTVGGRVITSAGKGIRNVVVTMTDASGTTRTTLSTLFGKFSFTDVPAGETYVFSVNGKRFVFNQPAQVYSITGDTEDIIFVGESTGLQTDN